MREMPPQFVGMSKVKPSIPPFTGTERSGALRNMMTSPLTVLLGSVYTEK
jgi:hypothetical protein